MLYTVLAQIETEHQGWEGSQQIATFLIDSHTQGITSREHAALIAREIVDHNLSHVVHVVVSDEKAASRFTFKKSSLKD